MKSSKQVFHIVHVGEHPGVWAVKRVWKGSRAEHHSTTVATFAVKRAAFVRGRTLAKKAKTSLVIHGLRGKFLEERSYGDETKRPG